MWEQPSRAEVGGGHPQVRVSITVLPDGEVLSARLTQSSRVMPMDQSVTRLLKILGRLPAFNTYGITAKRLEIKVVFELD